MFIKWLLMLYFRRRLIIKNSISIYENSNSNIETQTCNRPNWFYSWLVKMSITQRRQFNAVVVFLNYLKKNST